MKKVITAVVTFVMLTIMANAQTAATTSSVKTVTAPAKKTEVKVKTEAEKKEAKVEKTVKEEKAAKEAGYEIKVGKFPFSASGKAKAGGTADGFVKVIFDAKYGEWLGCHMIGAGVTDMIAEAVVARKLETTGHEILKAVHPHPTMSEAVKEATAVAYGEATDI